MVIGGEVDCVRGMGPDTVRVHGVFSNKVSKTGMMVVMTQ